MKRLPPLSPDVIVPGPPKRKSRAKTPSGQGRGHTDSEQRYAPTPPDSRRRILATARMAQGLIEHHAARWEQGQDWRVTEAVEALKVLREWLERSQQ